MSVATLTAPYRQCVANCVGISNGTAASKWWWTDTCSTGIIFLLPVFALAGSVGGCVDKLTIQFYANCPMWCYRSRP